MSLKVATKLAQTAEVGDFLHDPKEDYEYIQAFKDGKLATGLTTGSKLLDKHWKFTPNSLDMFLGPDNVGKSTWIWFIMVIGSKLHGWKWLVLTYENHIPRVKIIMIQFYLHQNIRDHIRDEDFKRAKDFVESHFRFIRIDKPVTAFQMLDFGEKMQGINAMIIDPYSSLIVDRSKGIGNKHDYDSEVLNYFKLFARDLASIWVVLHPFSEGARKVYPQGHEFAGFPMPLGKADAEGGQKFANRADSYTILHRMASHEDRYIYTELHVKKVKDYEITGVPTPLDSPVIMEYLPGGLGFIDQHGISLGMPKVEKDDIPF